MCVHEDRPAVGLPSVDRLSEFPIPPQTSRKPTISRIPIRITMDFEADFLPSALAPVHYYELSGSS